MDQYGNLCEDFGDVFRVSIVGHSYVRHLAEFARDLPLKPAFASLSLRADRPNWLDLEGCAVTWHAIPGGSVPRVSSSSQVQSHLYEFQPHVIFLQIGSNDLDKFSADPFTVAHSISELADNWIRIFDVNKIFLGQLVKRFKVFQNWNYIGQGPNYKGRLGCLLRVSSIYL